MAHVADLYKLISVDGKLYLVSDGMMSIIKSLEKGSTSYQRLSKLSDLSLNTLYIFCRRLEKAKILKRTKVMSGKPQRLTTVLVLEDKVKQCKMRVLV